MSTEYLGVPDAVPPFAHYRRVRSGDRMLYVSGQLPVVEGALRFRGRLGAELTFDEGVWSAERCALNCLAAAQAEIGDLGRIEAVMKVVAFVASADGFVDQHLVANGASDVFTHYLGEEVGSHARSAVGVPRLPMDAPVEVEATFAFR